MFNFMKTVWPLVLIAFFLTCCGSDNPTGEDVLDGDSSSSGFESKPGDSGSSGKSSSSHHHHHHGSSSSANPGVPDAVKDTLIQDTTQVMDVNQLPECTAQKEGESFFVASENTLYFCMSKEWVFTYENVVI